MTSAEGTRSKKRGPVGHAIRNTEREVLYRLTRGVVELDVVKGRGSIVIVSNRW